MVEVVGVIRAVEVEVEVKMEVSGAVKTVEMRLGRSIAGICARSASLSLSASTMVALRIIFSNKSRFNGYHPRLAIYFLLVFERVKDCAHA